MWPAGPKQAQETSSAELCAEKCIEFGEDCVAFTWNEEDRLCIFKSDWLEFDRTKKYASSWSGHRCDMSSPNLPQFPRHGIFPHGEILPEQIVPTTSPPTTITQALGSVFWERLRKFPKIGKSLLITDRERAND